MQHPRTEKDSKRFTVRDPMLLYRYKAGYWLAPGQDAQDQGAGEDQTGPDI